MNGLKDVWKACAVRELQFIAAIMYVRTGTNLLHGSAMCNSEWMKKMHIFLLTVSLHRRFITASKRDCILFHRVY